MFFNHALPFAEKIFDEKTVPNLVFDEATLKKWPPPKEIKFQVNDTIKNYIRKVGKELDASISDSDVQVVNCFGLGKPVWKQAGISPDAAVQMAMQLAYRRLHGGGKKKKKKKKTNIIIYF